MPDIAGQGGFDQSAAQEGDAVEAELEQEEDVTARDPRAARRQIKPTKAMIQAHELHHADYRDWCDQCRAGKCVSHQHRSSLNDSEEAEFSVDYVFMTKESVVELEKNRNDTEKVGAAHILVGCDHR